MLESSSRAQEPKEPGTRFSGCIWEASPAQPVESKQQQQIETLMQFLMRATKPLRSSGDEQQVPHQMRATGQQKDHIAISALANELNSNDEKPHKGILHPERQDTNPTNRKSHN